MRYAAAAMQQLLTDNHPARDLDAEFARDLQLAREAARGPSVRRRAGEALIAFGIRLAGDRAIGEERRLVRHPV